MKREEIFKQIEKEREYQDSKFGTEFDKMNSTGHWILYIEEYLNQAKKKLFGSRIPGGCEVNYPPGLAPKTPEDAQFRHDAHKKAALEKVKKIATLAVACLEHMSDEE